MSTAGKVLTVVVILALLGGIFLFAQIAQLNANWGEKINRLTEQVATLEKDVAQTRRTVETRLADVTQSQERRDRALTVLRARLSDVEKLQALNQEATVRVSQQVEMLTAANARAEKARADRLQQQQQTQQELAQTRSEVDLLQKDVAQRLDRLQNLRQQFLATHAENQKLLAQLRQRGGSAGGPTSRSAALTRPASLRSR